MQLTMSSMQQSISTMQQEVHPINLRVEQSQLDIKSVSGIIIHPVVMMRTMHLRLMHLDFFCAWLYFETIWLFIYLNNLLNIITLGFYCPVYSCPSEIFRGSNFYMVFIFTLFYPLSFCDKKGE
jgi:hypothetical protein